MSPKAPRSHSIFKHIMLCVVIGGAWLTSCGVHADEAQVLEAYLVKLTNSLQRASPPDWVVAAPGLGGSRWAGTNKVVYINFFYEGERMIFYRAPSAGLIFLPKDYTPRAYPRDRVMRLPLLAQTSRHQVYLWGRPYLCGWTNSQEQISRALAELDPDILVTSVADEQIDRMLSDNPEPSAKEPIKAWERQYARLSRRVVKPDAEQGVLDEATGEGDRSAAHPQNPPR